LGSQYRFLYPEPICNHDQGWQEHHQTLLDEIIWF